MESNASTPTSGQNRLLADFRLPRFERADQRTFFFALALYALVLFPILLADRYHVDDWGRVVLGYSNWDKDGRPLAELTMVAAALGKPMVDFSPIPQVAAIVCLSGLSVLVSRKFGLNRPFVAACASLPLGANPFSLTLLSVKFDSLTIALSMVCALVPTLQDERAEEENRLALILGCGSLLASLCLYQAALNAFLVFAILEFLFLQKTDAKPRKLLLFMVKRAGQLVVAGGIYMLVTSLMLRQGYGADNSRLIADFRSFGMIWQNFYQSWSTVLGSLWPKLKVPLLLPIAIALILSAVIGLRYRKAFANGSRLKEFVWSVIAFLVPIALVFATYGFLALLEHSPVRGVRTFLGFGALMAGSLILIVSGLDALRVPGGWQCALLSFPTYALIYLAAVYGNAAKMQSGYEKYVAAKLSDDIREVVASQPVDRLMIFGTAGYAPVVQREIKTKYQLLNLLIPVALRGDGGEFGFPNSILRYNGVRLDRDESEPRRARLRDIAAISRPIRTSIYYQVYVIDKELVVHLLPPSNPDSRESIF